MVQINFARREVSIKLVYYGPGRSGKTTNLEIIHAKAPKGSIGDMTSIATETDRTLFFDYLPLDLGQVAGMNTKFQLYTVPGQVYYQATRKLVLQGADGVIFVADSQPSMMEENQQSLQDLEQNLRENGLDINTLPLILQWNKRDLPDVLPVNELNSQLNQWQAPHFEAVAIEGKGVFPTLKTLAGVVIQKLNAEHGFAPPAEPSAPAPAPAAAPQAKPAPAAQPAQAPKPAAPAPAPAPAAQPAPQPAAAPAVPNQVQQRGSTRINLSPPASAKPAPAAHAHGGHKQVEDTSLLNPVAREIKRKREERQKIEEERLRRIRESQGKKIQTTSHTALFIGLGVGAVILIAILIIVYFVFMRA